MATPRMTQKVCWLAFMTAFVFHSNVWGKTIIENARLWQAPDHTRLVFDLSAPVEHTVFTLENPNRLVIDIKNSSLDSKVIENINLSDSPILTVRKGIRNQHDIRVVLDLTTSLKPKSFVLKPNQQYKDRLVIDLYDKTITNTPTLSTITPPNSKKDVVIAIDAGHGGEDPGALGPKGLKEKHVVLAIAKKLHSLFNNEKGFKPVLIRKGDYYIGLRKRTKLARQHHANLFVSIHADAFKRRAAKGASVFVLSQSGATSETGRWLASKENSSDLIGGVGSVRLDDKDEMLAKVLVELSMDGTLKSSLNVGDNVLSSLGKVNTLHKPKVEQAGFVVLKSPDIPSILVETGFISNPHESKKLANKKHQSKLANAIFNGIKQHFVKNAPPGTYFAKDDYAPTIAREN